MTFLNPLVLFGLVAASIPLLLHLLNLRKLQTIEFSSLAFLKELQLTKIRRLKLRQILLLIIRTLIIVFIILAFARPALRGTILGTIGSHANSSVAIILDNSYTMAATDEHGERLKQAKEIAIRIADVLKNGDEAFLIRMSDIPKATTDVAIHDFHQLRTAVEETQISPIHRSFGDALRLSAKLFQQSHNANKELYIISDMQETQFLPEGGSDTIHRLFDDNVRIFLARVGSKPTPNVAIDSISVTTTVLEKGKPIELFASIRNFSEIPLKNYVLSIYLDSIRVAQRNFSAEPWGSAAMEIEATPKHTGIVRGYIEIENDALEPDNRRYFTLTIPDKINVICISSSPADVQFVRTALEANQDVPGQSMFNAEYVTTQKLPQVDFKSIDVIICQDLTGIQDFEAQRIVNFVRGGGGLILFPSSSTQGNSLSSRLLAGLGIPPVVGVNIASGNASTGFGRTDYDHPLFSQMFELDQPGGKRSQPAITSPAIVRSVQHGSTKTERTVISMNNGFPFLSEYTYGEGKILFYAVAPVLSWSDFPLTGIFAPLVYRSVLFTANRSALVPSYQCGDEPALSLSQLPQPITAAELTLVHPDGTEEIIPIVQNQSGTLTHPTMSLAPKRLSETGFYLVKNKSGLVAAFAVNTDPREADPRPVTTDNLEKFSHRYGIPSSSVIQIETGQKVQATILQSRFGIELWRYCVALALLLALSEMAIARDSRKAMEQST